MYNGVDVHVGRFWHECVNVGIVEYGVDDFRQLCALRFYYVGSLLQLFVVANKRCHHLRESHDTVEWCTYLVFNTFHKRRFHLERPFCFLVCLCDVFLSPFLLSSCLVEGQNENCEQYRHHDHGSESHECIVEFLFVQLVFEPVYFIFFRLPFVLNHEVLQVLLVFFV